jgi:hypothetical protein
VHLDAFSSFPKTGTHPGALKNDLLRPVTAMSSYTVSVTYMCHLDSSIRVFHEKLTVAQLSIYCLMCNSMVRYRVQKIIPPEHKPDEPKSVHTPLLQNPFLRSCSMFGRIFASRLFSSHFQTRKLCLNFYLFHASCMTPVSSSII